MYTVLAKVSECTLRAALSRALQLNLEETKMWMAGMWYTFVKKGHNPVRKWKWKNKSI